MMVTYSISITISSTIKEGFEFNLSFLTFTNHDMPFIKVGIASIASQNVLKLPQSPTGPANDRKTRDEIQDNSNH